VAVGAVTTWSRPDSRTFLYLAGRDRSAYPQLTDAVVGTLRRRIHTHVDAGDSEAIVALAASGFDTELVEEGFRIRFDRALAWLDRAWIPSGFSIVSAAVVDEDRLFTLDNTLRQDTPGTDGWRGHRQWFHDEIAEAPPLDASAYLVAVDDGNGEYVGSVRIWRNPTGPRFGLVGVVRQYRTTLIGAALLKQALTAASSWGHDTFTAETSPANTVIHPRMSRVEAESLGQFFQMMRR
jgi:GNAT superfamily N-acetyltransferase